MPGWRVGLRLAPSAAPSSARRWSYPRFSSEVRPSSNAHWRNLQLAL